MALHVDGRMIDILVPVLARPHLVPFLVDNIETKTTVAHRLLFLCSTGDDEEIAAIEKEGAEYLLLDHPPAGGQYAKKVNLGYRHTENPWILIVGDDVIFHSSWAEQALHFGGKHSVVSTNDRGNMLVRQGLLAVHPMIERSYIDEQGCSLDGPGSIYHEGYSHNFVDCELSVLARMRREFVFARTSIIQHMHPLFRRTIPRDSTYEAGLRDFGEDRKLFCDRMQEYPRDRLVRAYARTERRARATR